MKILFIGGTGTISTECTASAIRKGYDVTLLNRGSSPLPEGAKSIVADINKEQEVSKIIEKMNFDVVVDFIAFTTDQVERDIRLFNGKTKQYIFISSASAYQKPLSGSVITESTPLYNPYWEYSRNKIACEDRLMKEYRENGFPITIVRPSHTYGNSSVPVALHGHNGSWQVIDRILNDKPVIVPGDGLTWWTVTHNTDFAIAFTGLLGNVHAIGEAFHITSDEKLTWNTIMETIASALGKKAKLVHVSAQMLSSIVADWEGGLLGDKCNSVDFDNSKIKRVVPEYCATVRFDQGVRKTLDYIMANPQCRVLDPDFDKLCDDIIAKVENFKN